MEETFDLSQGIAGIVGISIENLGRTDVIETLNSKLEILNRFETQNPNVQKVNFALKISRLF